MKRIISGLLILFFSSISVACSADSEIDIVKNSNFPGYPTTTIGKALDAKFNSCKWSAHQGGMGERLVRFEGKITKEMHDKMRKRIIDGIYPESQRHHGNFGVAFRLAQRLPSYSPVPENYDGGLIEECRKAWDKLYNYGNKATQKQKETWTTELNVCEKKLTTLANDAIDKYCWAVGDTIIIEWVMHSNGVSFELKQFGAATIGDIFFEYLLKLIFT